MNTQDSRRLLKTKVLCGFILFVISITGCEKSHSTIFSNQVCSPPCWENIQPGITTKQAAFELLSQVAVINKDTIAFRGGSTWIFDDELYFGYESGDVRGIIDIINDRVIAISFSGDLGTTLSEAFDKLGEPEYVINIPVYGGPPLQGSMSSGIQLINSKVGYGMIYLAGELSRNMQNKISPEIAPTTITYFDPQVFAKLIDAGFFSFETLDGDQTRKKLKPWDGYGDLTEKYPQVINDNK